MLWLCANKLKNQPTDKAILNVCESLVAVNRALDYLCQRGTHIRANIGESDHVMDGIDPPPRLACEGFYSGLSRDALATLIENSYTTKAAVAFDTFHE